MIFWARSILVTASLQNKAEPLWKSYSVFQLHSATIEWWFGLVRDKQVSLSHVQWTCWLWAVVIPLSTHGVIHVLCNIATYRLQITIQELSCHTCCVAWSWPGLVSFQALSEMELALARRRAIASGEIWASRIWCSLPSSDSSTSAQGRQVKLFLGSGQDASNADKLRENGVTHIVNVADDVENFHPGQFVYCNLNVTDFGGDAGISRVFDQAADFIHKATLSCEPEPGEGPGILVHCANGSNRSSTVVIACLMILQGLDLARAFNNRGGTKSWFSKTQVNSIVVPIYKTRGKRIFGFSTRLNPAHLTWSFAFLTKNRLKNCHWEKMTQLIKVI